MAEDKELNNRLNKIIDEVTNENKILQKLLDNLNKVDADKKSTEKNIPKQ